MIIKENIKVIAFDADDTLWENEIYFRDAEKKFSKLLTCYESEAKVLSELLHKEINNLSIYGYGVKSFMLSMIECALELSNSKLNGETISEILNIGKEMLGKKIVLIKDIEEVLKLLSKKYKLIVATKGDLLDQEKKLQNSGILKYFHHIEIMSEKKEDNYKKLLQHLNISPKHFLMIGNSLKSDVLPILKIGGQAIHIPFHTTWQFEEVDKNSINEKYLTIKKLKDLLAIL